MSKKTKRYDGEDGSLVETDTAQGQNANIGDDVRARAMAAMANRDSTPAPTPSKKVVGKAIAKAAAEESKPAPAPTKQQKAGPTMIKDSGTKSKSGMTGSELRTSLFGSSSNDSPRMRAAKRDKAMDASNYSMKAGGKVGSASKRADGIASKGKTRGKFC